MATKTRSKHVVRERADWMRPTDERIMELMRDEGNLTPQAVENFGICSRSHASVRLSKLSEYGLVERPANTEGLYRLTDKGEAFLNEELDASTLEPVDE